MKKEHFVTVGKVLLFLLIGVAVLYFVYVNQEKAFQAECACKGTCREGYGLLNKIWDDFKSVHLFWIGMVVLTFMLSNFSRAKRWNMLFEPLGYQVSTVNTFFTSMMCNLVNIAIPRAGEITRPATLARYEKLPMATALGTVVVDRVFDILMLGVVCGISFLVQFKQLWGFLSGESRPVAECSVDPVKGLATNPFPWTYLIAALLILMISGVVFAYLKRSVIRETAFYNKFKHLFQNFWDGIVTVSKLKRPGLFVFHTLMIWVMYYLMLYCCFFAFAPTAALYEQQGLGVSMLAGLLAFVFGTFGILIPSPGGMGTYQLGVMWALVIYGVSKVEAFSFANIEFFTIQFCNIFFGVMGYIVLPIYNRKRKGVVPTDDL